MNSARMVWVLEPRGDLGMASGELKAAVADLALPEVRIGRSHRPWVLADREFANVAWPPVVREFRYWHYAVAAGLVVEKIEQEADVMRLVDRLEQG